MERDKRGKTGSYLDLCLPSLENCVHYAREIHRPFLFPRSFIECRTIDEESRRGIRGATFLRLLFNPF